MWNHSALEIYANDAMLVDLILQPSLENRISSLMYKEGLYNKLDNLL
jgi:hypothetical protein